MSETTAHVLIVDDDPALRRMVRRLLRRQPYALAEAPSTEAALAQVQARAPDLVLLDLVMPGLGGLAFISEFRATSEAPIIVLSALGAEDTKVAALKLGADDYLTKPFSARELRARLARQLTRWQRWQQAAPDAQDVVLQTADGYLVLDPVAHRVEAGGRPLQLSAREFDLLSHLTRHADRVLTNHQLLRAVWGAGAFAPEGAVRVTIYRLRRKLEPDPERPRYLHNEPGIGYRLSSRPE